MKLQYIVFDVVNYILSLLHRENGDTISNLKLQKILYYLQGHYLACYDEPLFNEPIEAWRFGPVVKDVYYKYKDNFDIQLSINDDLNITKYLSDDKLNFIKNIFNIYNNYSATALVEMTHSEEPWKSVYQNNNINFITCESLKNFFKKKFENDFVNDTFKFLETIDFNDKKNFSKYEFTED